MQDILGNDINAIVNKNKTIYLSRICLNQDIKEAKKKIILF